MADIKSMDLTQAKAYQKQLKDQGKESGKEYGKVVNYIKTLDPNAEARYGKEDLGRAYEQLSSGVTKTGGWTESNTDKIYQYTGKMPNLSAPTNADEVSPYLNDYQDSLFSAAGSPETRNSIINELTPNTEAPTPLNRVAEFEKLREQYGVNALEGELTGLKAEQEAIIAETRLRKQQEEGRTVSTGVISGRVSEIERQQNERLDVINRTINTVVDQLQTSYGVIETYINFAGLDYQDAVSAYDKEFEKNLQIYKLVDEEMDEQQANARANLQIYTNAIIAGNIQYNKLSSDQKAFLSKLEVQSGLPVGFTASLKADNAEGKVLSTTTRESGGQKYADVVMQMPDGSMKVITQSLGASAGGDGELTKDEFAKKASKDMNTLLGANAGSDGYVSPTTWSTASKAWVSETGQGQDEFVKKFGNYVNPVHSEDYLGYDKAFN